MIRNDGVFSSLTAVRASESLRLPTSNRDTGVPEATPDELSRDLKKVAKEHSAAIVAWSDGTPGVSRDALYDAYMDAIGATRKTHDISISREKDDKGEIIVLRCEHQISKDICAATFRVTDGKVHFVSFKFTAQEDKEEVKKATPIDKKAMLKDFNEFIDVFCEQDSRGVARKIELKRDPALKNAMAVYEKLLELEAAGTIAAFATKKSRVERAAWITRNLHFTSKEVTADSVLASHQEVTKLQNNLLKTPILQGRTGIFLAHMETLSEVTLGDTDKKTTRLSVDELARLRKASGDDHRFGKSASQKALRAQMGDDALIIIRPEDSQTFAVVKVLKTHQKVLANWSIKDGEAGAPTEDQVNAVKDDLKKAVGLPEDEGIRVSYSISKDKSSASLSIFRDGEVFAKASVLLEEGKPDELVFGKAPSTSTLTPKEAKTKAIETFTKLEPGKNGFVFIFDGHGSGESIYLSDGAPREGGFAVAPDTVSISAQEFADACLARQKKFGSDTPDVIILACCMSQDFARDVSARIIAKGGASPIFICQTEQGQYGYSDLGDPYGSAFRKLLYQEKPKHIKTFADVIDGFNDYYQFDTNPSLFVPGDKKGIRQISDNRRQDDGLFSPLRIPAVSAHASRTA